jgi:hypothetical protein
VFAAAEAYNSELERRSADCIELIEAEERVGVNTCKTGVFSG